MKNVLLLFSLFILPLFAEIEAVMVKRDIPYSKKTDNTYQNERCKLDLYLPKRKKGFSTLIWLHGGGLKSGKKDDPRNIAIAQHLCEQGLAIAMVNYRLHPKAEYPAYVEDTAAAVAWTLANISEQGGDPKKVFLGGHSAGGYLTLMIGMDQRWLAAHDLERNSLAGLIPVAAQTMTHYTVRKERFGSDNPFIITADDAAPVRYANEEGIPPTLILWADNDAPARAEENAYLAAVLKGAKNTQVTTDEVPDCGHSSIAHNMARPNDPGAQSILRFIAKITTESEH
ncbi:MAG: alpha/beta hydrolase [Roseibacillus sp.]